MNAENRKCISDGSTAGGVTKAVVLPQLFLWNECGSADVATAKRKLWWNVRKPGILKILAVHF